MNVIMNPPYSRNLHLKILSNVITEFPDVEVVNLSPTRWIADPTVEYKKNSDYKRFENIRNHIENLEEVDGPTAEEKFGITLTFNLGIYHITEKGGWQRQENKLLKKMVDKVLATDNLKNHIVIDDLDGVSLLVSLITDSGPRYLNYAYINGFNLPKEKAYYTNKKNEATNETYEEYKKRAAWGVCSVKSENTNIKFATREERDNFYDSYNTKTLKWMFGSMITDIHVNAQLLPWLGDYSKKWTDENLYKYFDLTPEEIKEIEKKF